jgi:hypothetical protein
MKTTREKAEAILKYVEDTQNISIEDKDERDLILDNIEYYIKEN